MRQGNQIERVTSALYRKSATDDRLEAAAFNELPDCQSAYRHNEPRTKNPDLLVQPTRAVQHFVRSRHPIAATGTLSGKTAAHSREVNRSPNLALIQMTKLFEPLEQGPACSPRERFLQHWFSRPGCLANQDDLADDRPARDRC